MFIIYKAEYLIMPFYIGLCVVEYISRYELNWQIQLNSTIRFAMTDETSITYTTVALSVALYRYYITNYGFR